MYLYINQAPSFPEKIVFFLSFPISFYTLYLSAVKSFSGLCAFCYKQKPGMQSSSLLGLHLNVFSHGNALTKRVLNFMVDHKNLLI